MVYRGEAITRAVKVADRLRSRKFQDVIGVDGVLIIVSHAEFLDLLLQELLCISSTVSVDLEPRYLDTSADELQRPHLFRLKNTSHTLIEIRDVQVKVQWVNRCSHLQAPQV